MRKLSFGVLIITMLFSACRYDLTDELPLVVSDMSETFVESIQDTTNTENIVIEIATIEETQPEETLKTYPWDNKKFQYDWQKVYYEYCGNFDTFIWNHKTGEVKNIDSSEIYDAFGNYIFSNDWSLGTFNRMYISDVNYDEIPDIILNDSELYYLLIYVNGKIQVLQIGWGSPHTDNGYNKETKQFFRSYHNTSMGAGITDDASLFNWTENGYVETHIYSWMEYYRYNEEEGARYGEIFINGEEGSVEEFELVYNEIEALKEDKESLHYGPDSSNPKLHLIALDDVEGNFSNYIAENLYY